MMGHKFPTKNPRDFYFGGFSQWVIDLLCNTIPLAALKDLKDASGTKYTK